MQVRPALLLLDHLVVATPNLQAGAARLESLLGCSLTGGGQHLGAGTHNRLLNLGLAATAMPGAKPMYLELIAPDPAQASPKLPRPFGLDSWLPGKPADCLQLLHVVASTPRSIEAVRAIAPACVGDTGTMQRGDLRWQITSYPDRRLPAEGGFPTLIDWGNARHPTQTLPASPIQLDSLEWQSPYADLLSECLPPTGFFRSTISQPPRLIARLTGTLRDPLILDSLEPL